MSKYVVRRLMWYIPSLFMASILVFVVIRILPGDVAMAILGGEEGRSTSNQAEVDRLRESLGLNDPLYVQYGRWVGGAVKGDFGTSLKNNTGVMTIIAKRMPATLQFAGYVLLVSVLVSVPLGVIAGLMHNKWPDYAVRTITIMGLAMPHFWLALLLILLLVLFFNWVPPLRYQHLWQDPRSHASLMVWPVLIQAWGYSSYLARMTRSTLLEVMGHDYIRTAYSKGLSHSTVVIRHALKNSLLPVVTLGGVYLGTVLSGTVILESIFGIPGIGRELVEAVRGRDYPVIQGLAMLFITIMLTVNLVVDLLYARLDPRVTYR